jgi:hypothetical protein
VAEKKPEVGKEESGEGDRREEVFVQVKNIRVLLKKITVRHLNRSGGSNTYSFFQSGLVKY